MSNLNGTITKPVSVRDVQQVLGITGNNSPYRLILTAKSGGITKPGEDWKRAFNTREYSEEGAIKGNLGHLADGAIPLVNVFSPNSPIEWVYDGVETLIPKIKRASYLPSGIEYGFSIEFFSGYQHYAPGIVVRPKESTINNGIPFAKKDFYIDYDMPTWFYNMLPYKDDRMCIVVTRYNPIDFRYEQNKPDLTASQYFQNGLANLPFLLEGLPTYKDEQWDFVFYLSVQRYNGTDSRPENNKKANDYTFLYNCSFSMNLGKLIIPAYGTAERPPVVITMKIDNRAPAGTISYSWAYYTRISPNRIKITFNGISSIYRNFKLYEERAGEILSIPQGFNSVFEQEVDFPSQNYNDFYISDNP